MQFHQRFPLARGAALLGLALASLAAQADVASFSQSGQFNTDTEVHSFNLDIHSASDLRLWTSSYAAGQLDPVLALFDLHSGALLSLSDDVDGPYAQVDAGQGQLDAGMWITDLAPGQYRVAVSLSPNLPAGSSWADGYLLGSPTPVASGWQVNVALTNAAPVPEPAPTALLLAGLAVLGWAARRRG